MLSTTDGGESWVEASLPPDTQTLHLSAVAIQEDGEGWAPANSAQFLHSRLLKTVDGGRTFDWAATEFDDTMHIRSLTVAPVS